MINRKQLYTNQTSSRWKKVNKMRHFTVIVDLNVAKKEIYHGDLSFFCLFYSSICQLYNCKKVWFCNGICNFSNIFRLKTTIFNVKKPNLMAFKKKLAWKGFFFLLLNTLTFT